MPDTINGKFGQIVKDAYSQAGVKYTPTDSDIKTIDDQYKGDHKSFLTDFYKQAGVDHQLTDDDFKSIDQHYGITKQPQPSRPETYMEFRLRKEETYDAPIGKTNPHKLPVEKIDQLYEDYLKDYRITQAQPDPDVKLQSGVDSLLSRDEQERKSSLYVDQKGDTVVVPKGTIADPSLRSADQPVISATESLHSSLPYVNVDKKQVVPSIPATQSEVNANPIAKAGTENSIQNVIPQQETPTEKYYNQAQEEAGGAKIDSKQPEEFSKFSEHPIDNIGQHYEDFIKSGVHNTEKFAAEIAKGTINYTKNPMFPGTFEGAEIGNQIIDDWQKSIPKDPDNAAVTAGKIVPYVGMALASIFQPELAMPTLAVWFTSGTGEGLTHASEVDKQDRLQHDQDVKDGKATGEYQPMSELKRQAYGIGYGTANTAIAAATGHLLSLPVGSFMTKALLKNSPELISGLEGTLKSFAEQAPAGIGKALNIGKQYLTGVGKSSAGMFAMTGGKLATNKLLGEDVGIKDVMDAAKESIASGIGFESILFPFGYIRQTAGTIQRRNAQGTVAISVVDGKPAEIYQSGDKYYAVSPKGITRKATEADYNNAIIVPTDVFNKTIETKTVSPTIQRDVYSGRIVNMLNRISDKETGNVRVNQDENGNSFYITGKDKDGNYSAVDTNGQTGTLPSESKIQSVNKGDVYNALMAKYDQPKESQPEQKAITTANQQVSNKDQSEYNNFIDNQVSHFEDYIVKESKGNSDFDSNYYRGIINELKTNPAEYFKKQLDYIDHDGDFPDKNVTKENATRFLEIAKSLKNQKEQTPITTATIEGQQYTVNNPEDLGVEGKPVFVKDDQGNITAVSGKKKDLVTDVITQTPEEIAQVQQQAKLMEGIDPNAKVTGEESDEEKGIRVVMFDNRQTKIITPEGEHIANNDDERDAILSKILNVRPEPAEEVKPADPIYTFNNQQIEKEEAIRKMNVAAKMGKTNPISHTNDPDLDALVEKHWPTPVASFKIGKDKISEQEALDLIDLSENPEDLAKLKHENIEVSPVVYKAYQDKVALFAPNFSKNVNIENQEVKKVSETNADNADNQQVENVNNDNNLQKSQLENKEPLKREDHLYLNDTEFNNLVDPDLSDESKSQVLSKVNTVKLAQEAKKKDSTVKDYVDGLFNDGYRLAGNEFVAEGKEPISLGKLNAEKNYAVLIESLQPIQEVKNEIPVPVNPKEEREFGYRILEGQRINRQSPIEKKIEGKDTSLEFKSGIAPKGKLTIIEADEIQPSHTGKSRNPLHFIPEAQPKERTDEASDFESERIADNLDPSKISQYSSNVYFGAPTVNSMGEVIQGNNRATGLKKYWGKFNNDPKQYRQYLIDNASQLGIDPESISKFKNPVLVNMLDVSDQQAIELGQYKGTDLESGGSQRISPAESVRKAGDNIGQVTDMLTRNESNSDLTLREIVRNNALSTLKYMQRTGIINDTQFQTAFKNNAITGDAIQDLSDFMTHSLFDGARADLNVLFDRLPHNMQMGIIKSLPIITMPEGLKEEVQGVISAHEKFASSPWGDIKNAVQAWSVNKNMFDPTTPQQLYGKVVVNLLDKLLGAKTQNDVVLFFRDYKRNVLGGEGMMAELEPAIGKAKTIEKLLNVKEDEQTRISAKLPSDKPKEGVVGSGNGLVAGGTPGEVIGAEHQGRKAEKNQGTPGGMAEGKPAAELTPAEKNISDLFDRYDKEDNFTFDDLVNETESIANETGDQRLLSAIADYRKEQEYDRSISGRGDMDQAQSEFESAVRPKEGVKPEVPEQKNNQVFDFSKTSRDELLERNVKATTNEELRAIQLELKKRGPNFQPIVESQNNASEFLNDLDYTVIKKGTEKIVSHFGTKDNPLVLLISGKTPGKNGVEYFKVVSKIKELQPSADWGRISVKNNEFNSLSKKLVEVIPQPENKEPWQNKPNELSGAFPKSIVQVPVFHGSREQFDEFDESLIGKNDEGVFGKGIYLSENKSNASQYGGADYANIKSYEVDVQKPYIVNFNDEKSVQEARKLLSGKQIPAEYDGVIVYESGKMHEVVIRSKSQIKRITTDEDIWKAYDEGKYQQAIKDGTLTEEQAKEIVESSGIKYKLTELKQSTPLPEEKPILNDEGKIAPDESKPEKITDFGEVILGAKKDRFKEMAKLAQEATVENLIANPLSKVFPEPDYKKLVESGELTPSQVSAMKVFREQIPSKPKKSYKVNKWAETANMYIQVISDLANKNGFFAETDGKTFDDFMDRFKEKYPHEVGAAAEMISKKNFYDFAGPDYNASAYRFRSFVNSEGRYFGVQGGSTIKGRYKTEHEAFEWLKNAIDQAKGKAKNTKFSIYLDTKTGKQFIGYKAGSNVVRIKEGFEPNGEAFIYLSENQASLEDQLKQLREIPDERKASNSPRIGTDYRNGKDVTPELFSETFGFRGVQFGNYVENDRRIQDLNEAYDALMDLANVLNIPAKAISLNGELGMAFGARGSGRYAAHYESGQIVINITKTRGAGSMAHEWFHALDNYFERARDNKNDFVTDFAGSKVYRHGKKESDSKLRIEVLQEFADLNKAIEGTGLYKRSRKLDATRSKPYWGTTIEMNARAFEWYIKNRIETQGGQSDYLANLTPEDHWETISQMFGGTQGSYPYPTTAEAKIISDAFDHVFNTIETKQEGNQQPMFSIIGEKGAANIDHEYNPIQSAIDHLQSTDSNPRVVHFDSKEGIVKYLEDNKKRFSQATINRVKAKSFGGASIGGEIFIESDIVKSPKEAATVWVHERMHSQVRDAMDKGMLTELYNYLGEDEIRRVIPYDYWNDPIHEQADEYLAYSAEQFASRGKLDDKIPEQLRKLITNIVNDFTSLKNIQDATRPQSLDNMELGKAQRTKNASDTDRRGGETTEGVGVRRENATNQGLRENDVGKGKGLTVSDLAKPNLAKRHNASNVITKLSNELGEGINVVHSSEAAGKESVYYDNGKLTIISDKITSVSDVVKSILHAVATEKGLRETLAQADPNSTIGKQLPKFDDLNADLSKLKENSPETEKLSQIFRKAFGLTGSQFAAKDMMDIIRDGQENESILHEPSSPYGEKKDDENKPIIKKTGITFKDPNLQKVYDEMKKVKSLERAKPKEPEEEPSRKVGVSHDNLNELAKRLELPEVERGKVLNEEDQANRGRMLLAEGVDPNDLDNYAGKQNDKVSIARAYLEKITNASDAIEDKKSDEFKESLNKIADYQKNVVKVFGTEHAATIRALTGSRDMDTDSFTAVSLNVLKSSGQKELTDKQSDEIKGLTDKAAELNTKVKDLEKKLIEQTNEHIGEKPVRQFTAKKAAEIADNFLAKAKLTRPGSFAMVTPGSIVWDGAVEVVAKSIKLSGKASDAINEGIAHIRATRWYEGLTHEKQNQAEQDFRDFTEKELTTKRYQYEVGENKRIAGLEKQLSDLQNGTTPEKKVITPREKSDQEQDLLSQIKEEKAKIKDKLDYQSLVKQMANHRGNDFTPDESKAIWDYAKKKYLSQGTPFRDMISNVSNDLSLSFFQVSNAIITPKTKPITDEMWRSRYEMNRNRRATQDYINKQSPFGAIKAFKAISNTVREVKVFGHGGVFVGTHSGMTLMDLPRAHYTVRAFMNAYKMAYGSNAGYEMLISDLKGRKNFVLANKAGLQNDPDRIRNDSEIMKPMFGKMSLAGLKGFNAIKVLRQDLFDSHYNDLTPEEQKDGEVLKEIAKLVNNATGATNIKLNGGVLDKAFSEVTFAGGMEFSRWEKLLGNPAKAAGIGFKAGHTLFTGENMKASDKVFIKTWSKRVGWELGSYLGLLVINAALQNYLNDGENPVNLTDWRKSDWLKMKAGSHTIDFSSGMISTQNFIKRIALTVFDDIPLNSNGAPKFANKGSEVVKQAARYGRGKLAPFYADVADVVAHHDYNGNTLPWFDDKPEFPNNRKLTWKEYLMEKSPLPVGEGINIFYDEAHKNGVTEDQTDNVLSGILGFGVSGLTGFRTYSSDQGQELSNKANDLITKGVTYKHALFQTGKNSKTQENIDLHKALKDDVETRKAAFRLSNYHFRLDLHEKLLYEAMNKGNSADIKKEQAKLDATNKEIIDRYSKVKFPDKYKYSK